MKGQLLKCADCQGTDRELRRRPIANGSIQFVYQCLNCGRSLSNAIPRTSIDRPDLIPDWDALLSGHAEELRRQERQRERETWFREHNIYLRSTAWKTRRFAVMARAKGVCEGCGSAAATQVHHLTYEHWREEFLWELVAICEGCHERIHPHMKHPNWGPI